MTIYAMIKDGEIITSPSKKKDHTKFTVERIEQLYIDMVEVKQDPADDTLEPAEFIEPTFTEVLTVKPFDLFKEDILKQIENVYNYISNTEAYKTNDDYKVVMDKEKELATRDFRHFIAHTKSLSENTEIVLEGLIQVKMEGFYNKKKELQATPVTSPIDGVDFNFYNGENSKLKYQSVLEQLVELPNSKQTVLVLEGLKEITEPDLRAALTAIRTSLHSAWLRYTELYIATQQVKTKEELDALVW